MYRESDNFSTLFKIGQLTHLCTNFVLVIVHLGKRKMYCQAVRTYRSLAIPGPQGMLRAVNGCQGLSRAVEDCHGLSGTVVDCSGLSGTAVGCWKLSRAVECCQGLSWTVKSCQ